MAFDAIAEKHVTFAALVVAKTAAHLLLRPVNAKFLLLLLLLPPASSQAEELLLGVEVKVRAADAWTDVEEALDSPQLEPRPAYEAVTIHNEHARGVEEAAPPQHVQIVEAVAHEAISIQLGMHVRFASWRAVERVEQLLEVVVHAVAKLLLLLLLLRGAVVVRCLIRGG